MTRNAVHQLTGCLGAVVATLGLIACPPSHPANPIVSRPECPRDSIFVQADSGYKKVSVIAGSGPISLVPEYHDCQRMLIAARDSFGPLIAIFARNGLDTMKDAPRPQGPPRRTYDFAGEQAAATILDYDRPYEPLRIESGFNCLYLYSSGGVWKAHIVKVSSDSACLEPLGTTAGGTDLNVKVIADKDVPPVARWDWDSLNREQYIGIRCGTQWCEVYNPSRPTVVASPKYAGPPLVSVKGWYDEQVLAVNGVGSVPMLVPSGVIGTIFPIGQLDQNTEASFKEWKPVARVSLSAASPAYLSKFNFIAGPAPNGQSVVSLCKGTQKACGIPDGTTVKPCDQNGDPWWAMIVSGPKTQYHCVIRRQHTGVPIPGVVRWRWQTTDDDMWIRCPTGCCQVT